MKKEVIKKLKKYSAAAVSLLATGAAANAQVVYNQVNKTLNLTTPIDSIDINLDGNYDLKMHINHFLSTYVYSGYTYSYSYTRITGGPLNNQGHAMAGSMNSSYNYPFKLNAGAQIAPQIFMPANIAGTFAMIYSGVPYSFHWQNGVVDGFLGMKLQIGANVHFGWVRMDIAADAETIVIKDMAYQATPNVGIAANEQGLNLEDYVQIANSVWVTDNRLHTELLSSFAKATLNVIDLSGKTIQTFKLNGGINTFELSEVPSGTYVLSLVLDGNTYNKTAVIY